MQYINEVLLYGKLGKDAAVRALTPIFSILQFSIAVNEHKKLKDGTFEKNTMWVDIEVKNEHMVEKLKDKLTKGTAVTLRGKLEMRSFTNKEGIDVTKTSVSVGDGNHFVHVESADGSNSTFKTQETGPRPAHSPLRDPVAAAKNKEFWDGFEAVSLDDDVPFS